MTARQGFDTLAPEAVIGIDGSPLPAAAAADVIAVQLLDDTDAAGLATVLLAGWDTLHMKARWLDDAQLSEGHAITVDLGYADRTARLFDGEITGVEADFPAGRPPTLQLRAHDRRHRLMRAARTRSFTGCKDSDIATRIASDNGLRPQVHDSGFTLPYVLQHAQTDLDFLRSRAQRLGWEVWVRARELFFRPPPLDAEPALTLHREVDLLSFRARLSTFAPVTELQVRGWDPATKQPIVGRAQVGDEGRPLAGDRSPTSGAESLRRAFERVADARVDAPVQHQAEADGMARQRFAAAALGFVRAEGEAIGHPQLQAGTVVRIEGLGERHSGRYYLTAVQHAFDRRHGYRTRFHARRNAT
jgi:uncharacterized protein